MQKLSQRYSPLILPIIALPPRFSPERDRRDYSAANIFTAQNMSAPVNLPFSISVRYAPTPPKLTPEYDREAYEADVEWSRKKWK